MLESGDRARFLNLAGIFEGGMVFFALALAWVFNVDVVADFRLQPLPPLAGLLGALPPFLMLLIAERLRIPPLERIKKILHETMGPSLAACRWYDLILLSALAGFGEELLFRGVVQPVFERWIDFDGWTRPGALFLSNVIFGLLHLITPTYSLLAGGMGIYFGLLLDFTGSRNLLGPIVAHGLYDYLAFLVVIRTIRKEGERGA
jgi:uncharacterized protein